MIIVNTFLIVETRSYWKRKMNLTRGRHVASVASGARRPGENESKLTSVITSNKLEPEAFKCVKKQKVQIKQHEVDKKHKVLKMVSLININLQFKNLTDNNFVFYNRLCGCLCFI